MRLIADVDRRGEDQARGAEQRAAGDRDDEHRERVDAQRGAVGDRLDELLQERRWRAAG